MIYYSLYIVEDWPRTSILFLIERRIYYEH